MIALAFGTRPEYLKLKRLYKELLNMGVPVTWFRIGQHIGKEIGIPEIDNIPLEVPINESCYDSSFTCDRLSKIVSTVVGMPRVVFEDDAKFNKVKLFVVQGDTASAFAVALKAFNLGIPVAHVEAGMRTNSVDPYPEEAYRQMITVIAKYHFCPSMTEVMNVRSNKLHEHSTHVYLTGNTIIDDLVTFKNARKHKIVLCTIHRRDNKDNVALIYQAISSWKKTNPEYTFILIEHPSMLYTKDKLIAEGIKVIKPLPHDKFLKLLKHSSYIISDSGGLSEEANFLGVITLIIRDHSERPDSVDYLIPSIFAMDQARQHPKLDYFIKKANPFAYGKGYTSFFIAEHLKSIYKRL